MISFKTKKLMHILSIVLTTWVILCLSIAFIFLINDIWDRLASWFCEPWEKIHFMALGGLYSIIALIGYNVFRVRHDILKLKNTEIRYCYGYLKSPFALLHGYILIIVSFICLMPIFMFVTMVGE